MPDTKGIIVSGVAKGGLGQTLACPTFVLRLPKCLVYSNKTVKCSIKSISKLCTVALPGLANWSALLERVLPTRLSHN